MGVEKCLVFVSRSRLTWFLCRGSIDLVFGWVVEIDMFFRAGIRVDLIFVLGSKKTWFQSVDGNWIGLFGGSTLTPFHCRDRN